MTAANIAVIVLAAGLGTRMKSNLPKVLHRIAGRSLVGHVMATVAALGPARVILVVGPGMAEVAEAARMAAPRLDIRMVIQRERRGTGHAVRQAAGAMAGFAGDALICYGDVALVTAPTLARALAARRGPAAADIIVIGMRPPVPGAYGRLVVGSDGTLERIVEARDASDAERAIGLCNSGVIAAPAPLLFDLLRRLKPSNAQGELYLTDIIGLARAAGRRCAVVEGPADELIGIDSRAALAAAEATVQGRLRAAALEAGATLVDPASVHLSWDTRIGRDVRIEPHVVIGPGVTIGDGGEIRAFCHLEGARVGKGARIGPFARLRPGAEIGAGAHVGNFVEIKAARIEPGAKVNHLAYIGDARVGARANVGAGTITCNYDGFVKSFTDIGPDAFVGSNSTLVAPVRVGKSAFVAAGSVITDDVPGGALALGRARQVHKTGWAKRFRARRRPAAKKKD